MTDLNKRRAIDFAKVLGVAFPACVALIAFSGILNAVVANGLESFYGWLAGLNLAFQGYPIYLLYKKLFKKE